MLSVQTENAILGLFRKRFMGSIRDAARIQHETLFRILRANAHTWFGLRHDFAAIRSVQDYQKAVPMCTYEDIVELIERSAAGEHDVLTRGAANYFQITSGSTSGQQKLIPSTSMYQRKMWEALLTAQGFLRRWAVEHGTQGGQGLMLANTVATGTTKGGIPFGPASANVMKTARPFWRSVSVTPFEVTRVADSEARRYVHWRLALLAEKLFYISSPYMPYLLTSASTLFQRSDELIRDIANGALSSDLPISITQREALTARLRPNRHRAAVLERIAANDGGLTPRAVWQDLTCVLSVHGPSFSLYEQQIADCYGQKFFWGYPYLACEGIIGFPRSANAYTHVPAVSTTFLEFIPEKDWSTTNPRMCMVAELESGMRYDVVLTSWNGMYRYRLGDVIEVEGDFSGVPTFKIVSRRGGVLSIGWEKTTEAQVVAAVAACESDCDASFTDFVVDIDQAVIPPRYRLWAELSKANINLGLLGKSFDAHLRRTNPSYGLLRQSGEIGAPIVRLLPAGTFERFRHSREREGAAAEQIKILHSMTDWKYASTLQPEA